MELLLNMSVTLSMAFAAEAHLADGQINNNNKLFIINALT